VGSGKEASKVADQRDDSEGFVMHAAVVPMPVANGGFVIAKDPISTAVQNATPILVGAVNVDQPASDEPCETAKIACQRHWRSSWLWSASHW
jgi:hypothetical protein